MLLLARLALPATSAGQERGCDPQQPFGPSRDLYCVELLATPGLPGVTGRVELSRDAGPFTVEVGADGRPRTRLILRAAGLPAPSSLGSYRTFVAWITPPTMDSITRLGVVRNGTTDLGTIALEKYTILISAERDAKGREPAGRVVLRGQSPATRLFPPDLMQFSIGAMAAPRRPGGHDRDGMSGMHGGMEASDSGAAEWTTVPMSRGLTMLPAEMTLRPDAPAWLPSGPAPLVRPTERVRLASGDTLRLEAAPVRRTLDGRTVTMFAFNGQ